MTRSILAQAFGRFLRFNDAALCNLALGAMLMDIGKTSVPVQVLAKKASLTDTEQRLVQGHVEQSVRILEVAAELTL